MLAVPQAPSPTMPGKQGLSHGTKDSRAAKQRRFSLTAIFSWKKLKVSPVITSVTSSEEVALVERLQRLDLQSQWSNLPDHLLESIFMLMKDGDKDDWAHVQVASSPKPTGCMQWCTCELLAHPSTSRRISCCASGRRCSIGSRLCWGVLVHALLFSASTHSTCTPDVWL